MFQTSSCDRKLPTHCKCHTAFWADFLFLFPFSPLSHFFSSKSIQKLLPKLSSSIVVLMTSFPSLAHPCLMIKVCLHFLGLWLCLPLCHVPLIPASSHHLLHRIVIFDVSESRYLIICTLNKESIPVSSSQTFPGLFQTNFRYVFTALELKHLLRAWHCPGSSKGEWERSERPGSHSSWGFGRLTGIYSSLETEEIEGNYSISNNYTIRMADVG